MTNNGVAIKPAALKLARLRKGWSLRATSDATEAAGARVDFGAISRYERGIHLPYPRTLLALATALGITVDDLLADEDAA